MVTVRVSVPSDKGEGIGVRSTGYGVPIVAESHVFHGGDGLTGTLCPILTKCKIMDWPSVSANETLEQLGKNHGKDRAKI